MLSPDYFLYRQCQMVYHEVQARAAKAQRERALGRGRLGRRLLNGLGNYLVRWGDTLQRLDPTVSLTPVKVVQPIPASVSREE